MLSLAFTSACTLYACGGPDLSDKSEDSSAIVAFDETDAPEPAETKKIKFENSSSYDVTVKYKKGGETVEAIVRAGTSAPSEEYDLSLIHI